MDFIFDHLLTLILFVPTAAAVLSIAPATTFVDGLKPTSLANSAFTSPTAAGVRCIDYLIGQAGPFIFFKAFGIDFNQWCYFGSGLSRLGFRYQFFLLFTSKNYSLFTISYSLQNRRFCAH